MIIEKMEKTFKQFLAEKYGIQHDYSSTQINLPEEIAKRILTWSDDEVPDDVVYTSLDDPSFGREDEIHITVLYGIHTADVRPVEKLVDEKTFEITLGKLSLFTSNDKFDVLKIDVKSDRLHKLHELLKNSLKSSESYPHYIPHVTIAYVKKGKANKFIGDDIFADLIFMANEVIFSSKTGEKHKIKLGVK